MMKKIFIIGSLLLSALLADNSLGTPITNSSTIKLEPQRKSYSKDVENPPLKRDSSHKRFKKDDHRYDKRYRNFDYEREGYYSDDDYYYGYYDEEGYFYNNIFFTYNSQYTYYDRRHRRGYFRPSYRPHRIYEYHIVNDWNRVHCYREPNQVVYGYYYERPSYNNAYRSSYYNNPPRYYNNNRYPHYRSSTRMNTSRATTHREPNTYRSRDNRQRNYQRNEYRGSHNADWNKNQYRRGDTRMRTRSSGHKSGKGHGSAHMQLSK